VNPLVVLLVVGLALVGSWGCGPEQSEGIPVSGTVTFEGAPIPDGYIVFKPIDGAAASDAGKITAGKFEFSATPGAKRVEIDASRPGAIDPESGTPNPVQYIPAQYNRRSNLRIEVSAGAKNCFDFDLRKAKE
jgi:hypothetical protein